MNLFFWILQILLALHTIIGAFWKFSNAEQAVPSLAAIPHGAWTILSIVEILCALGMILPLFNKRLKILAPIGAGLIGLEMLAFCGIHVASGDKSFGPVIYWMVVAILCDLVVLFRLKQKA